MKEEMEKGTETLFLLPIVGDHFFSILNVPVASDLTSVLVSWPLDT